MKTEKITKITGEGALTADELEDAVNELRIGQDGGTSREAEITLGQSREGWAIIASEAGD